MKVLIVLDDSHESSFYSMRKRFLGEGLGCRIIGFSRVSGLEGLGSCGFFFRRFTLLNQLSLKTLILASFVALFRIKVKGCVNQVSRLCYTPYTRLSRQQFGTKHWDQVWVLD